MFKVYDIDIIPMILKAFKVNNIVLSGLSDDKIVKMVLDYCDNDSSYVAIDSKEGFDLDYINDYTLNVLPTLSNFDAIFINDDSNWYTVYNELKCIKKVNGHFPLTFICNDVFPNKFRDSYMDPKIIPKEYLNDFSLKLPIADDISIKDGFYHAVDENTPKNGVSVAISDFLNENPNIGVMDLKLVNGITILYSTDSINHIRFGNLCRDLDNFDLELDVSDGIIENKLLTQYLSNLNISDYGFDLVEELRSEVDEKEKIIEDFEYKINQNENELEYKDSQIQETTHRLDLKDSKIKVLESKLYNKENEIQSSKDSLKQVNAQIESLKNDLDSKEVELDDANNQIDVITKQNKINEDKLRAMGSDISYKNIQIRIKDAELLDKSNTLNHLKKQASSQMVKLENNEYCISCYKKEIENNNLEIQYLKDTSFSKRFLSLFDYLLIAFKSNPKEIPINFKLYRSLKNSKCFDIGYYLNNNKDIIESRWCKYFSPELHYICKGFDENRKFNKKYFNRNSKKELLEYILKCNY